MKRARIFAQGRSSLRVLGVALLASLSLTVSLAHASLDFGEPIEIDSTPYRADACLEQTTESSKLEPQRFLAFQVDSISAVAEFLRHAGEMFAGIVFAEQPSMMAGIVFAEKPMSVAGLRAFPHQIELFPSGTPARATSPSKDEQTSRQ